MFTRLARSWELTKQSWGVLRQQKSLLLLPVVSGVLSLGIVASFLIPVIVLMAPSVANSGNRAIESTLRNPIGYAWFFAVYFLTFAVVTFFNAALVACVLERFEGRPASLAYGLAAAARRWRVILVWTLLNATLGVVLQILQDKAGWLGRLLLGAVGAAWTIATFFAVPVLVMENVGPIDAVKRSWDVLRKTWGESLIVQVSVNTATSLIGLGVFLALLGGGIGVAFLMQSGIPVLVGFLLGVLAVLALAIVSATLKGIVVAACYRLATTGEVPEGFDQAAVRGMIGPKK